MSKGLGKVERGILEAVKSGECEPSMITCFVYGLLDEVGDITERPSMAQHKSTLRAINKLASKALVKVARVKIGQYRHRLLGNAAWEPFAFPDEQSLIAFCEKPPGYVMEIKVNGRTVFDCYWSTESRARLLQRYLSVESSEYVHFRFTFFNPTLEVGTISGHYSDSPNREYPDKSPHILVASMAHSRMF